MTALDLFADVGALPPIARRTDPASSHVAAAEMRATGAERSQAARVLAALVETPGCTDLELASRHGLDRYVVGRRTSWLRTRGYLVDGEPRTCRVSGRLATPRYPTQQTWSD